VATEFAEPVLLLSLFLPPPPFPPPEGAGGEGEGEDSYVVTPAMSRKSHAGRGVARLLPRHTQSATAPDDRAARQRTARNSICRGVKDRECICCRRSEAREARHTRFMPGMATAARRVIVRASARSAAYAYGASDGRRRCCVILWLFSVERQRRRTAMRHMPKRSKKEAVVVLHRVWRHGMLVRGGDL